MPAARSFHAAALLPDGKVLIVGGDSPGGSGYYTGPAASADLYDPASGTFAPAGEMSVGRIALQATSLRNGDVLITGGFGTCGGGCSKNLATAEIYHPPLPRRRSVHR